MSETAEGPYFDDLQVGQVFDSAPAVTLNSGLGAMHQSIVGGRLALVLDGPLGERVTGAAGLVSPALVWDLVIGQSTVATVQVKANLFYRGLVFRRFPEFGDTLRTRTTVVALHENRRKEGRRPTGLAALRITATDQRDRPVLDFWRCAMLPLRADAPTGHADDLDPVGAAPTDEELAAAVAGWRLDRFDAAGPRFAELRAGRTWRVDGGDVVSSAPELARLTLNVAKVHHDRAAAGGERLVYGGHTIGLAVAQATRALPGIATVVGWHACDHLAPVHEGDTLRSTVTVERLTPLPSGGLAHLRSLVRADGDPDRPVLDWRYVVALP